MSDILARVGWTSMLTRMTAAALLLLGVLIGLTDDPWYAGIIIVLGAFALLIPTAVVVIGAVERCAGRSERDEPYRVERCPDCDQVIDVRLLAAPSDPVAAAERLLEHRRRMHPGRLRRRS